MSIWKKIKRIKDVIMDDELQATNRAEVRQKISQFGLGKQRRIEFINTRTDESVYYEEIRDGDRIVSTEGDPRLKGVMDVIDSRGGDEKSMEEPEVREAIAAVISEITGEDLTPQDVGFSVSSRKMRGAPSSEGWKKRALH